MSKAISKTELGRKGFCDLNKKMSQLLRDYFNVHGGGCTYTEADAIYFANQLTDKQALEILGDCNE